MMSKWFGDKVQHGAIIKSLLHYMLNARVSWNIICNRACLLNVWNMLTDNLKIKSLITCLLPGSLHIFYQNSLSQLLPVDPTGLHPKPSHFPAWPHPTTTRFRSSQATVLLWEGNREGSGGSEGPPHLPREPRAQYPAQADRGGSPAHLLLSLRPAPWRTGGLHIPRHTKSLTNGP